MSTRLRVVVAHRPPFVFADNLSGRTYYGLLIDLLEKILASGNVTYQYDAYQSPTNAGGTLSSAGWSGVIGELVKDRADVALFPLTRTASRLTAIDCTYSYLDQGLSLLVRDEEKGPGALSVLAPFKLSLWMTLLCTVVGVALVFWALDAYGRWIRAKQTEALRETGVISDKAAARARRDERSHVLISFMAAAGAPERPERSSWGVQVLYVMYCFFCLIVLSAYTANLTSFLAVRRAEQGIAGLTDLIHGNLKLGVNPNGSTAAYFASSHDTIATQLQPNIRYCDSATCVSWLRSGAIAGFVSDQPALAYLAQQQPCDLAVVGDPFGPGNLVLGLQKNSTLLPLFNAAIQRFAEDGTLTTLRRAWFDGMSQCSTASSTLDNSRLGVQQMVGAFVFLIAGIVVAFVTGTVENLKWCLARAYARTYTELGMLEGGGGEGAQPRLSPWTRISHKVLGLPFMQDAGLPPLPKRTLGGVGARSAPASTWTVTLKGLGLVEEGQAAAAGEGADGKVEGTRGSMLAIPTRASVTRGSMTSLKDAIAALEANVAASKGAAGAAGGAAAPAAAKREPRRLSALLLPGFLAGRRSAGGADGGGTDEEQHLGPPAIEPSGPGTILGMPPLRRGLTGASPSMTPGSPAALEAAPPVSPQRSLAPPRLWKAHSRIQDIMPPSLRAPSTKQVVLQLQDQPPSPTPTPRELLEQLSRQRSQRFRSQASRAWLEEGPGAELGQQGSRLQPQHSQKQLLSRSTTRQLSYDKPPQPQESFRRQVVAEEQPPRQPEQQQLRPSVSLQRQNTEIQTQDAAGQQQQGPSSSNRQLLTQQSLQQRLLSKFPPPFYSPESSFVSTSTAVTATPVAPENAAATSPKRPSEVAAAAAPSSSSSASTSNNSSASKVGANKVNATQGANRGADTANKAESSNNSRVRLSPEPSSSTPPQPLVRHSLTWQDQNALEGWTKMLNKPEDAQ
ncbi:hypothetical protein Agub_g11211 [Astrephomene gubernaculifera]|uniref:Ionotropic glutamate receptor C-terminal domain-containing protein n=1 Tax=Astrephomene gubernaculifera TaxID=47775 RepID=A0AAD3DXV1_9CHLO|nr:hypothetical protein Agub_g11211 [Astrephomene gubernaculifera]